MKHKVIQWLLLVMAVLFSGQMQAQKKVHTIGDSTMQPHDDENDPERGWGMYLGNFLTNGWTSVNYAKGGRDARGGYEELWQNAKKNVSAGDYVIIQFGHNDGKYSGADNLEIQEYYKSDAAAADFVAAVKSDGRGTTPSTTYKAWLKKIIDEVKAKGAIPVLASPVCRDGWSGNKVSRSARHDLGGKYCVVGDPYAYDTKNGWKLTGSHSVPEGDHTMDYPYHMKQLANAEGVYFIDMTTATAQCYEEYGPTECYNTLFDKTPKAVDHTHYNMTGALTAARLCAQLMKDQGILAENIYIPTELAVNPQQADLGEAYVGQSAMKELTLSGLGLDPSAGTITVTATEGIDLSFDKSSWQSSISTDYSNGSIVKSFYARMMLSSVGQKTGTITVSLGTTNIEVPVTANAIELGGGDPFTVTWDLNAADNYVVEGQASASDVTLAGMMKCKNQSGNGILMAPTGDGTWQAAEDDSPNQYVQFTVTAPEGRKLDINQIGLKVGAWGGNTLKCHIYYSTDGFVTRHSLNAPSSMTNKEMYEVSAAPVVKLDEGDQLQVRVYPWNTLGNSGKWVCISNVVIGGQSKDAAGVNINGTIAYALDKGGLSQGDDVVFTPNELSAGFAGKSWTAGSLLTVEGSTVYDDGTNKTTQTRIYNAAEKTALPGSATQDNTLTLTLTPEDGFSFVPSKVSFQASRFGTDGGKIGLTVEAGADSQVLVTDGDVNRSGKKLELKAFAEAVNGITATADNPLKLNFAFLGLGGTKTMGLSNVVIEGTLVGAAAQVTKYVLNTQVAPAEAGSITREPDLAQYKEGTVVTLKASKNFGYKFKEWQDGNGTVVATDAQTTVTMDGEKTMKAVYEAVPVYTVKTKATNDTELSLGSVTLTPNDHEGQYEAGTKITAVANESKILKFLSWTDENENAGTTATRELTVNGDMTLVANYEVQDFIAVFDASKTESYAYEGQGGYPYVADETWDKERNTSAAIVKVSDGSLVYSNPDKSGTPVVRNRVKVVVDGVNGLYQNGYRTSDIAWQYQFSTKGFTSATFVADMAAKNAATKQWKAQIAVGNGAFEALGEGWEMTANAVKPLSFTLPAAAIGQEKVVIRIMGDGTEVINDNSGKYVFDKKCYDLDYTTNSESGVGNVYVLGDAEFVADEVAPKCIDVVPADGATGVSASGKVTFSFDERIVPVEGAPAATLNGNAVSPTWSNKSVSFDYSGLDYGTAYTFVLPANYVQDRSGNKFAEQKTVAFTTMERPVVTKALYDFVVPDDGTVTQALAAANGREDKSVRYRIFLKNGTYTFDTNGTTTGGDGKTYPDPRSYLTAANTSFIGESMEGVVITNITPDADAIGWNNGWGIVCPIEGIGNADVLCIQSGADNSYFQNLTIKSSMGDRHGRDIALQDYSNHTIFKDACLWAYQDTYVSRNNQFYFEGGAIRGRTDFICGSGDVFFNKVDLIMCQEDGYVVAPQGNSKYGYVFKDCTIKGGTSKVNNNYFLGRAWSAAAEAYFINTTMEAQPKTAGWSDWNNGPTRFAEYHSVAENGAVIDLSGRAKTINDTPNSPVLSEEEAATIGNMASTFGDWLPTLYTEQAPVPSDVKAEGATLTWTGSDYALLYAVCLDGSVVAFTTEPAYTATQNGTYTVRAANEMGGLSAPSEAAVVTDVTGIRGVSLNDKVEMTNDNAPMYNLAGQRVGKDYKGIVIRNGKKVVMK